MTEFTKLRSCSRPARACSRRPTRRRRRPVAPPLGQTASCSAAFPKVCPSPPMTWRGRQGVASASPTPRSSRSVESWPFVFRTTSRRSTPTVSSRPRVIAASKSMEKLSSGYRINRAADDAAGLAISEKMRGQIGGLAQAQRNAQDGISLVQTAEGALTEVHSMLQRVRDLAVQYEQRHAQPRTTRTPSSSEVAQLGQGDLRASATTTTFNGNNAAQRLGRRSRSRSAPTTARHHRPDVDLSTQVGVVGMLDVVYGPHDRTPTRGPPPRSPTAHGAGRAHPSIDTAINNVSTMRADFGAVQNRLEHRLATWPPTRRT